MGISCSLVFFFKQKTAYELRISDWSSDVCPSDLKRMRAPWAPPRKSGLRKVEAEALHADEAGARADQAVPAEPHRSLDHDPHGIGSEDGIAIRRVLRFEQLTAGHGHDGGADAVLLQPGLRQIGRAHV